MSFSSTNPPLLLNDPGFAGSTSAGPRTFFYGSTHTGAAITVTGFFAACGVGGRGVTNATVGMRLGDLLIHRCSTDAADPGRVTHHSVVGSTWNQSSTTASTAWGGAFDITISST